jgi:hypothetical protein
MVIIPSSVPIHVGWVLLTDAERITVGQYLVSIQLHVRWLVSRIWHHKFQEQVPCCFNVAVQVATVNAVMPMNQNPAGELMVLYHHLFHYMLAGFY